MHGRYRQDTQNRKGKRWSQFQGGAGGRGRYFSTRASAKSARAYGVIRALNERPRYGNSIFWGGYLTCAFDTRA